MKIVILDGLTANPGDLSWSEFAALGACTVHDRTLTAAEVVSRAAEAEAVMTNKAVLSGEVIRSLPRLKYIGVLATGYNVVDVAAARERGIAVTNVPGYSSASVAQAVFALLLEMTNHTGHLSREVHAGRWTRCDDFCFWDEPLIELDGLTMGLVGFGDIGAAVARIACALGMKVRAARRSWPAPPPAGVEAASVESVLTGSDVVSLHCPLTDETRALINAGSLQQMKRHAYLINTARGPLVDEAALAAALTSGHLAGAGLDVLSVEPPRSGSPLFGVKNCVITPHVAWASRAARSRLITKAAANLKGWLAGQPVNLV